MKDRVNKGVSVQKHIDDYSIVDLETTGVYLNSAEILEISALKIRNNQVVDWFTTLVNPKRHIPKEVTILTNINDEMVKNALDLDGVIDAFIEFIGDDVLVGYNNAGFDMNLLYDKIEELRGLSFVNNYIDILHSARRCINGLDDYKLETLCNYYSLDTSGEHRAYKDCELTKQCYDLLFAEFGESAFHKKSSRSDDKYYIPVLSYETAVLQELNNFLQNIVEDENVTQQEIYNLNCWVEEHRNLQGTYPFDKVFDVLDRVLEDGIVSLEEMKELQKSFMEVTSESSSPVLGLISVARTSNPRFTSSDVTAWPTRPKALVTRIIVYLSLNHSIPTGSCASAMQR